MAKILITGASGQLGQSFQLVAPLFADFDVLLADRKLLDVGNTEQVNHFFDNYTFDYCINCAAYTAVDKAEEEKDAAYLGNVTAVENLAQVCSKKNIQLIHFSTDYVHHNQQNTAFEETDELNPQNVYAQTKLAGENYLVTHLPQAMIVRTSWVYSPFGHNFVKTMLRLGKEREQLSVVEDQIGTPTYAPDLALAIMYLIERIEKKELPIEKLGGIFNYSNEGVCSWYDFAKAIFEISNIDCAVTPIASSHWPTPALRPPFSLLNKTKFKTTFNTTIPYWRDSLKQCIALIVND